MSKPISYSMKTLFNNFIHCAFTSA